MARSKPLPLIIDNLNCCDVSSLKLLQFLVQDIESALVVVMTPVELTREFYSDVPELIPVGEVDERVLALYAFDDGNYGTIYVRDRRNDCAFDFKEKDCDDPAYLLGGRY